MHPMRRISGQIAVFALLVGALAGCSDEPANVAADTAQQDPLQLDMVDPTCTDDAWKPPAMAAPLYKHVTSVGQDHAQLPEPITYQHHPPSSGTHRPAWAKWGHYSYLPPQRWLHNLEHGGIALLYHPCAGPAMRDELWAYARAAKPTAGDFLWILSPYPALPAAAAIVAWEEVLLMEKLDKAEIDKFVQEYHRYGPEDVAMSGSYNLGWLGE